MAKQTYNTDIFIKTYGGDFEWLKYCLRSIQKFCTGFNKIILVCDEGDRRGLEEFGLTKETVFYVPLGFRGYLFQQWIKLNAHTYSDADYILFVDSDCVFTKSTTPNDFIKSGKPVILKTPYETIPEVKFWKDLTELTLKQEVEFEYMRRLPLLYRRDTIENCLKHVDKLHEEGLQMFIANRPVHEFSEFNLLGAYAEKHEGERYKFLDTTKIDLPETHIDQGWSYGGLKQSKRVEMERLLS